MYQILWSAHYRNRPVGLVVKASASRAEGPGFESRWRRDFSGSSHTSDFEIGVKHVRNRQQQTLHTFLMGHIQLSYVITIIIIIIITTTTMMMMLMMMIMIIIVIIIMMIIIMMILFLLRFFISNILSCAEQYK